MKAHLATGISLDFELLGAGQPLLLAHGTGCDRSFWKLQVEHYSKHWQVIAVDMRGSGRSDVPPDPERYTTEVMADDLAALVQHLDVGSVHVAGHSLGSCVAQQLALRHPKLVRTLQLHATWAAADNWLTRAFIGTTRYPLARADMDMTFRTVMMWMMSAPYLDTWAPARVASMVRACFIDNPHLQANEGMLGHLHADEAHDTTSQLHSIHLPTLVTAGESDVLIPARYGQRVASLIPAAELRIFSGPRSSHSYNWELEDEFNEVSTDFLKRHS